MKTYIDERLEQLRSEKIADAQEVLEYLTSVMRGEHTEQVLRLDGDGVQVVDSVQTPTRDRLRAAELIGKRYGMFKDAVDLGGAVPVVISGGDDLAD